MTPARLISKTEPRLAYIYVHIFVSIYTHIHISWLFVEFTFYFTTHLAVRGVYFFLYYSLEKWGPEQSILGPDPSQTLNYSP